MKYLKIMLLVAILSFYLVSVSAFTFIRGDVDRNSRVELTDAVYILNYLFLGGSEPECLDAADTNDDSRININDAVFLLNYLFKGGKTLPLPYPERGMDSTWDDLDCGQILFKIITVGGGLSGNSLTGMNEEGKITGLFRTDKPFPNSRIRPFLWEDNDFTDDQPGSMTDLLEFSRNPESRQVVTKVGINDKSQVVLTDQTEDGIPYIWQDNILTRLPMEDSLYEALSVPDINNKGEIVGLVRNRITRDILVVFWNNNNFYPIGSRFPGSSLDIEINEESQILVNNEELRSEIWELDENFIVSKRTLLMNPDDSQKTNRAYSINNVGQVVGEFWVLIPPDSPLAVACPQLPCALPRAFLWNEKEGMTRLNNVLEHEQTRSSVARDLNDYGAIVGYTDPLGPDEDFGVIWTEGKQFRLSDLNNEGWKISHAYYINNNGWIAAEGYSEPGKASYLLLIPTNDPILG